MTPRMGIIAASLRMVGGVTPPVEGDPFFANVALLLHFDSAIDLGASLFSHPDNSSSSKTITGVNVSANQSKFGGASVYLNGQFLRSSSNAGLDLNGSNFTVEGYARIDAGTTGFTTVIDFRGGGTFDTSWIIFIDAANRTLNIYDGTVNSTVLSTPLNSIPAFGAEFFHFAIVANGANLVAFINGGSQASVPHSLPATHSSGIRIGANQAGTDFLRGYIDELRITKGVARYTANFTPPTAPFPNQ